MSFLQDLRYAGRMLAKSPGFTSIAVLSLALGIGANCAIIGLVNSVLLKFLPVERPDELVLIKIGKNDSFTNPIWEELRSRQTALTGMFAFSPWRFSLTSGGEVDPARGLWVSGDYFRVLGVQPEIGRLLDPADDRRGGGAHGPVAVLSFPFWQSRFGGSPAAVGQNINIDGQPFEIVGVSPPGFYGTVVGEGFDVAIPISAEPLLQKEKSALNQRSYWWLYVMGRRPPGDSLTLVRQKLNAIAPQVFEATRPPETWQPQWIAEYLKNTFELEPAVSGVSNVREDYRRALHVLWGVVAIILLIACANLANLLLARASSREREIAVRLALGSGRARLIRQFLTESLLLAAAGATIGVLFALWGARLLVRLISTERTRVVLDLTPDWRVLLFAVGVTVLTAFLFGIAPALRGTRLELNRSLKEGGRGASSGRLVLDRGLVVVQTALSLVLLLGASLFLRSFQNLSRVDRGFDSQQVLIANVDLRRTSQGPDQRAAFYSAILDRLRTAPGVISVAQSEVTPISGASSQSGIRIPGAPEITDKEASCYFNGVSSDYFRTFGTTMLAGRDFTSVDGPVAPRVAIVNQTFANRFFGGASPVGRVFRERFGRDPVDFQIVGLVQDAKYRRVQDPAPPTVYRAYSQQKESRQQTNFSIRYSGGEAATRSAVTIVLKEIDANIAVRYRSFEAQVNESLARERLLATLSTFFGGLALLLAVIGLYGLGSYLVARRRREIGVRMALGAQRAGVLAIFLRQALALAFAGTVLGVAAGVAASRLISNLLYGLDAGDTRTAIAAVSVLLGAAAVAAWLPARRAANLDPMTVLREE